MDTNKRRLPAKELDTTLPWTDRAGLQFHFAFAARAAALRRNLLYRPTFLPSWGNVMRRLSAVATAALLLGACADDAAKSWIGSTDAELLASWGAPDQEARTESGRVLTWTGNNGNGTIVCSSTAIVNKEGIITAAHSDC